MNRAAIIFLWSVALLTLGCASSRPDARVGDLVGAVVEHGFPISIADASEIFEGVGLKSRLVPHTEEHERSSGVLSWRDGTCSAEFLPLTFEAGSPEPVVTATFECSARNEQEANATLEIWRVRTGARSLPRELPVLLPGRGVGTHARGEVMRLEGAWRCHLVLSDPRYGYTE